MRLFLPLAVATQAAPVGFRRGQLREAHDLAHIPAPGHMLRPWTVAGFAAVSFFGRLEVWGALKAFVDFLVAGPAGIHTGVLRRRLSGRPGPARAAWLRFGQCWPG